MDPKDEYYESDVDYSLYGKVKDEEDEFDYDTRFDLSGIAHNPGRRGFGVGGMSTNWTDQLHVGKCFPSKADLVEELRNTAVMEKFGFKAKKSKPEVYLALCRKQGCSWRLWAAVKNEPNAFWVTKYVKVHTCSMSERSTHRKKCSPKYIGKLFIDHFGIIDGIVPKHIQVSMHTTFQIKMDYNTAYRAMIFAQEAVRGKAECGYAKLPSYLKLIERANPGTVTDLVRGDENEFKYLFISFAASIAGFAYTRRVIVVDGTHLNGKYEGVMLVAAAQDANFQVFPLAFGIVDLECDDSWLWFFTNLRKCFSDEYPLAIVSDRHLSIPKACEAVLPWATRGICYYHLQQNIVSKFKGRDIMYLVKGAAYAYTVDEYNRCMDAIKDVNPLLAKYLEDADPQLWSRVYFPGERYNIKTSNIAETLNAVLKKAKGFPIYYLLEFISEKLGSWFSKRRQDALNLTTLYSRGVENLLQIRSHYADTMTVERIDFWHFYVRGGSGKRDCVVDLEHRTCSCGLYQVEKIPCSHVIAAITCAGTTVDAFVASTYQRDCLYATYAKSIMPIEEETKVGDAPMRPPLVKPGPGRKKKSRWQTMLELSRKRANKPRKTTKHYNCSRCKQPGHTKRQCVSLIY